MQRIANPFRAVRLRLAPPFTQRSLIVAAFACAALPGQAATEAAPAPAPCAQIYTAGYSASSARAADPLPALSKPAKGAAFSDPTYKTCVVRATDHAAEPPRDFARNDYSRRQAFNADSSRFIVYSNGGTWHLYDARSFAYLRQLVGPGGDAEPQWHPTNPELLYYLPSNGIGMKLLELNVATGFGRVVADLTSRIKARWPSANAAWTKSEGSPSADGRYWCFMVDDAGWKSVGVVTWDRDEDRIVGSMSTNGERPDHVSMSPSGNHCVVSGDGPRGTVAYSRDFSQQRKLHPKSEHSDLALDAAGDDVYVSIDFQSNAGDVFMVNLRTGAKTVLFPTYISGSHTAVHFSGKAHNKPGWVLVSTYGENGALQWMHRKVFAIELKAKPRHFNLAHHHSRLNGYWTEPHASVNRDFTRVLFSSNWGSGSATDIDAYMVQLPADAVR